MAATGGGARLAVPELIARKRDGGRLKEAEIRALIAAYASGELPDEQMAAMAMAIYFRGLDPAESAAWTDAMLRSGDRLDLSALGPGRVDKHSTGGVGDKVSLVLAPAAAACGVKVPMISGRGLGHTGGTIDKLETIPGFRADLDQDALAAVVADCGCVITGQTGDIAPADKRMYALRDVTGTVASIPLIVSSIMSKKLAEDLEGLVLDVKVGRSAWMKTEADGRELAEQMVAVGERMGVRMRAFLTRMEAPIGRMVGNACEVEEALATLDGRGPEDLVELVVALGGAMVELAHQIPAEEAHDRVRTSLTDGSARARFERMVALQGGDLGALPRPRGETVIAAPRAGYVHAIDGLEIALTGVALGAGRRRAGDAIDPRVGFRVDAPVGAEIAAGAPMLTILHGDAGAPAADVVDRLRATFTVADGAPAPSSMILARVG